MTMSFAVYAVFISNYSQEIERQEEMKPDFGDLFDLLGEIERLLPKEWPSELPPEDTPGFWETATRQEFTHRATLTEKIRLALTGGLQSVATWSAIEAWLYQRRAEWTTQLVLAAAQQKSSCSDSPQEFLLDVMVDHWHDCGALAFWEHAMERDGKPHPETDEDVLKMMS